MEPHVEEQQDDTELPEDRQHRTLVHQTQHGGSHQETGADLAHHGRETPPFGQLGDRLRRHDDDQHIEEDLAGTVGRRHGGSGLEEGAGTNRRPGFPAHPVDDGTACRSADTFPTGT
jgi:hypothetical protein